MDVLIPSEQGKCSNRAVYVEESLVASLNPFGTGKVFKLAVRHNHLVCLTS